VCEQLKADAVCRLEAVQLLGAHPRVEQLHTIYLHMAPLAARRAAWHPPLRLLLSSLERRRSDGHNCAVLQHRWQHRRVLIVLSVLVLRVVSVLVLRVVSVLRLLRLLRLTRPLQVLRLLRPTHRVLRQPRRVGIGGGIDGNSLARKSSERRKRGDAVVLEQLREVCGRYTGMCGLCLQPAADGAMAAAWWRDAAAVILGGGGRRHLAPLTLGGQVTPGTGRVAPGRRVTAVLGDHRLAAWGAVGIRRKPRAVSKPHARRLAISMPHAIANRREVTRECEGERLGR
jgi:hypothetical protein